MYVKSDFMMSRGFQSLTILQLDSAGESGAGRRRRRKRALPPDIGVLVKAVVQFSSKGELLSPTEYESAFASLTEDGTQLPTGENIRKNATVVTGEQSVQ